MKVEANAQAVAADRKTKSLIISAPRVSAPRKVYCLGQRTTEIKKG